MKYIVTIEGVANIDGDDDSPSLTRRECDFPGLAIAFAVGAVGFSRVDSVLSDAIKTLQGHGQLDNDCPLVLAAEAVLDAWKARDAALVH